MVGSYVLCAAFRVRICNGWIVFESGGDSLIEVQRAEPIAVRLSFTTYGATEGKIFVTEAGERLWRAPETLLSLAVRQGEIAGWSPPFHEEAYCKKLTWGAASFQERDRFHRLWWIAGARAIATADCACSFSDRESAVEASLPVIQSFRWRVPP
jgi:hypothetical protein